MPAAADSKYHQQTLQATSLMTPAHRQFSHQYLEQNQRSRHGSFGNTHQTNSSASFGANGIYVLQLTGTDGQYTGTNTVTIAVNTTLSISLTAPGSGSTTPCRQLYLEATAACASGSVTNVGFYANGTLVGKRHKCTFTFAGRV